MARFGGDEFAILASNMKDPTEAGTLAARIAKILADPFVIDGHKLTVTSASASRNSRATLTVPKR